MFYSYSTEPTDLPFSFFGIRRVFDFALVLVFLTACSPSTTVQKSLEAYRASANELISSVITAPQTPHNVLAYPERRQLRITVEQKTINFSEFFQLSNCNINRLIGEHNSTLNQNQGYSERLFYDAEFILLAEQCLTNKDLDKPIHEKLSENSVTKKQSLQRAIWNASFASKEFSKFFSSYTKYPSDQRLLTFLESDDSINTIKDISEALLASNIGIKQLRKTRAEFDKTLGQLSAGEMAGKILRSMRLVDNELTATTTALRQFLTTPCRDTVQAQQISQHIATYRNDTLPTINKIKQSAEKVREIESLVIRLQPTSDEFRNNYWQVHWQQGDKSSYGKFVSAMEAHRQTISRLENHCQFNG